MSLNDILEELKAENPEPEHRTHLRNGVPRVEFGRGYWDRVLATGYKDPDNHLMTRPCPPKEELDGTSARCFVITEYEMWWLEWRLRIHLRSYRAMEWLEMEEVIGCLLNRISLLSTHQPSPQENSNTPVVEPSRENSMSLVVDPRDSDLNILNVLNAQPRQLGQLMESVPLTLETSLISQNESLYQDLDNQETVEEP